MKWNLIISTGILSFLSQSASTATNLQGALNEAKSNIISTINLIHQRFQLHDKYKAQFFNIAMNLNANTWDIMKYKFAKKITSSDDRNFRMIFGGSSVTAGWDNYYFQSYPEVFKRRMSPAFINLGVNLTIHNIAQGDNRCRPSDYCYTAMGGEAADWLGWVSGKNLIFSHISFSFVCFHRSIS